MVDYEEYEWNTETDGEAEFTASTEDTIEEEPLRVTEKPATDEVDFIVHRPFTWHGEQLETGEHTWPEDKFNEMLYDVNLRTDRLRFVTRV